VSAQEFSLTAVRAAGVLAGTAATLVKPHDVLGTVTRLLIAATEATGAAAAGLILRRLGQDHLELLAATSHRAEELELYQVQSEHGPCFDAVEAARPSSATSAEEIARRWPEVAGPFAKAGYRSAYASPLIWQGDAIGALNLFWTREEQQPDEAALLLQAFTDMCTLTIVHGGDIPISVVLQRVRAALNERTVIEQAKGVLAQQRRLTPDAAFTALLDLAVEADEPVTRTAATIVSVAATGRIAAE
jgi:hypothetical protein